MKSIYLTILACLLASSLSAQKLIGDFSLANAQTGSKLSLYSHTASNKVVVVIFTCNYCPYSKLYENRISKLSDQFQNKGVSILMINPNNPAVSPDDAFEKMQSKLSAYGNKMPYLADPNQEIARIFDAKRTPEAFVLAPKNGQFEVVYSGALDNNPQSENEVTDQYLVKAIEAVLAGKLPQIENQRATGCMIRGN